MADLSTLDDRVLWNRATQARCEDAFRALMTRHEDLVWSVCTRLLRHTSDAEDAFQMAFIALLEHGDDVKSSDFRPWLYRVAYRAALRVQSGRLDVDALNDANSVPEDSVDTEVFRSIEQAEQTQLIDEALDSLPEKYREVLVLHYCCGVARDDIASQLGLSPQTVKARLSRARKALRSRLLRRGLSLAIAAALLGSKAQAAVPSALHNSTWQLAQQWLAGEPVGLDLAQFSDFPQTEYGMKSLSGLNAKWTLVGAAALLALFVVYEAGKASGATSAPLGVSDGTNQLPAGATRIAFDEPESKDIVPAAHFVAKPTSPEPPPLAQNRTPAPVQRPQTYARPPQQPAYANQMPRVQMVADSQVQQQPARGLPDGTWKRDNMFGSVSFLVNGNQLQVDFQGKGDLAMINGSLLGEYSVASDGTIYGLFHGLDMNIPPGTDLSDAGELAPLMGMVNDSPFAMRVHTAGGTMVLKKFTVGLGLPPMDGVEEYAGIGAMAGLYFGGTYRLAQPARAVGQLPPRASNAYVPMPRRTLPLAYRQANPLPATVTVDGYPSVAPPQLQYPQPTGAMPAPSGYYGLPQAANPVTPFVPAQPQAYPPTTQPVFAPATIPQPPRPAAETQPPKKPQPKDPAA